MRTKSSLAVLVFLQICCAFQPTTNQTINFMHQFLDKFPSQRILLLTSNIQHFKSVRILRIYVLSCYIVCPILQIFSSYTVFLTCHEIQPAHLVSMDTVICTTDCNCPLERDNSHQFIWLIPYNYLSNSSIMPRLDSDIFEYQEVDKQSIAVFEIYSVKGTEFIRQSIGTWESTRNTLTMSKKPIYERRRDLKGVALISVFEEYKPTCVYVNATTSLGIDTDVLNALAKHLNFTYTITLSPERLFDGRLANGTWIGKKKVQSRNLLFTIQKKHLQEN